MAPGGHERYRPGDEGETWYEHWHRYHFALPLAAGRVVLDAACGEGYGSALIATRAARVTGLDLSGEAIAGARRRYGAAANLEYLEGSCERMPFADAAFDLVVSFETLEHIADPAGLVREAVRVLRPGGVFLVSTPNKAVYSDQRGYRNPFHVHEMPRAEFEALLGAHFEAVSLWAQRVDFLSAIWPLDRAAREVEALACDQRDPSAAAEGLADPMYFIAACGSRAALEAARDRLSLLCDRDHSVQANVDAAVRHLEEVRAHAQRMEAAWLAGQERLAQLAQERDRLAARLAQVEAPPAPGWGRK